MTIRWSLAAWEAIYPDPTAHWWKPWPGWEELRRRTADAILDGYGIPRSLRDAFFRASA